MKSESLRDACRAEYYTAINDAVESDDEQHNPKPEECDAQWIVDRMNY